MSDWTDELREQVINEYKKANPTPETSVEIVSELAEKFDKTPNGVRMVLTRADVYVKKDPAKTGSGSSNNTKTSTRVSKADAMATLISTIQATGQEADEEIISKLTGKAAVYFTKLIENIKE